MTDPSEREIVDAAYAYVRAHGSGELRFDEHLRPINYIVAPDGMLVAPVMVAMIETPDTVLFVPECTEGSMELEVTIDPFEESGPDGGLCDRWRIYHGDPPDVRWARLLIDAARYHEMVIDGEVLVRPNPLAAVEARWCRAVNGGDLGRLAEACAARTGTSVTEPRLVGIDPLGIDVRARFGVLRVPFGKAESVGGQVADAGHATGAGHAPDAGHAHGAGSAPDADAVSVARDALADLLGLDVAALDAS